MGVAGTGKYATFVYGNKTFYFVRVTADDLAHQFYVKSMMTSDVYEVTYDKNNPNASGIKWVGKASS